MGFLCAGVAKAVRALRDFRQHEHGAPGLGVASAGGDAFETLLHQGDLVLGHDRVLRYCRRQATPRIAKLSGLRFNPMARRRSSCFNCFRAAPWATPRPHRTQENTAVEDRPSVMAVSAGRDDCEPNNEAERIVHHVGG